MVANFYSFVDIQQSAELFYSIGICVYRATHTYLPTYVENAFTHISLNFFADLA